MHTSTRSDRLRFAAVRSRAAALALFGVALLGVGGAGPRRTPPGPYDHGVESPDALSAASQDQAFTAVESGDFEEATGEPFPLPLEPFSPLGSLVYGGTVSAAIDPGDTDTFAIEVDAGQTISAILHPAPTLRARLALSEAGARLADEVAAAPGETALLPLVATADRLGDDGAEPRSYALSVAGVDGSAGAYTLEIVLNALIEEEDYRGAPNDSPGSAQDIEASFLPLLRAVDANTAGDHPDRGAVRGALNPDTSAPVIEEDFESGELGPAWFHFSSSAEGRIRVTGDFGTAAGEYALVMDRNPRGVATVNQAIWTVDLTGIDDAVLVFRHADFRDEENPLPREFTGRARGDGVAISDDGIRWYTVLNATHVPLGAWQRVEIDLATAARAADMTLGADFSIRFQQDDDYPIPSDGRAYDEIRIVRQPRRDLYAFQLEAGETAALAVSGDAPGLTIDLLDASGRIAAEGAFAADPIVNGSFETRDFTGWKARTPGGSVVRWFVDPGGFGGELGLSPTAPQDGNFVAWNRFDGRGPIRFVLSQMVALPADAEPIALRWRDRIQWSFERGNFASEPRRYRVELRDPATQTVLDTLFSFSTGTQDTNLRGDTGWRARTADLSAYAGRDIRLVFVEDVPQVFTGLGQVEIDQVRVGIGDLPVNADDLIAHFEAPTSGTYLASVRGSGDGDYRLVIARNAALDLERNDDFDAAQQLITPRVAGRRWVLGHVSSGGKLLGASQRGHLFEIDARTARASPIGVLPNGSSTEIEYDPLTGRAFNQLWGSPFAGQEFDVDTATGVGGLVFDGASFTGLEYVGPILYGAAVTVPGGPSTLRILDPESGASTIVGTTGVGPISGLAYDPDADALYGIAGGAGPADLYALDRATGVATPIGPTGFQAGSLELGPDGALYGGGTGPDGGHLFRIDPATGASTPIGSTGFAGITGLLLRRVPLPGDRYRIELGVNEPLELRTYTPAGAGGAIGNALDPALRLYDAAGNRLAEDDDSAPDGRNARLKFHPGRSGAGAYFVEIDLSRPDGVGGEYLLSIK